MNMNRMPKFPCSQNMFANVRGSCSCGNTGPDPISPRDAFFLPHSWSRANCICFARPSSHRHSVALVAVRLCVFFFTRIVLLMKSSSIHVALK